MGGFNLTKKYRIVDVDAHYIDDPRGLWKYLDEPWRTRIRDWGGKYYHPANGGLVSDSTMGGRFKPNYLTKQLNEEQGINDEILGVSSSEENVKRVMDHLDIETIVMIPTYLLHVGNMNDKSLAIALSNAHADYMLENVANPSKGIYCALPVPAQNPAAAKALIDRVGDHPGICSILIVTEHPVPPLGSDFYDPIYEAAIRHNLPVICHGSFSGPDSNTYIHGLEKWVESHSLDFMIGNMAQLTSIVMQGVLERFPGLKFIFQEAGIFYIPMIMYRLDTEYMRRRSEVPILKKLPSEYIKEMYFGTQPIEIPSKIDHLKYVFEMIDAENTLMYASDYPHYDWDHPSVITKLPFLTQQAKQKILGDNARNAFRFNEL